VTLPASLVPAAGTLPITPESEARQRAAVVAEARSWVGTPYRQLGYTKGPTGAVDCSMLLVAAWVGSGVVEPFDPRPYPPEWHLHRSEERYLAWMQAVAVEVPAPRVGDVAIYRFGRCFSHGGVVVSPTRIVHAFLKCGMCLESELDDPDLVRRPTRYFDVWARLRQQAED
jgi:cell wall-associated NlpC family hydrolase